MLPEHSSILYPCHASMRNLGIVPLVLRCVQRRAPLAPPPAERPIVTEQQRQKAAFHQTIATDLGAMLQQHPELGSSAVKKERAAELLRWTQDLGLLEEDQRSLTKLGEIWARAFGEPETWPADLSRIDDTSLRFVVLVTQLAADGWLTLILLSLIPAEGISLKDLAERMIRAVAEPARSRLSEELESRLDKICRALQDSKSRRQTLTCRLGPLTDLGLVTETSQILTQTPLGMRATALLTEMAPGGSSHRELACRLGTLAIPVTLLDAEQLKSILVPTLREQVRAYWPGHTQWPVRESLLVANLALLREQRGFELAEGEACLELIRRDDPGSIHFPSERRHGEWLFRFAEDAPAGNSQAAQPPSFVWLRDLVEDQLFLDQDRPAALPLLGLRTALHHLRAKVDSVEPVQPKLRTERFWSRLGDWNDGEEDSPGKTNKGEKGIYQELLAGLKISGLPVLNDLPMRLLAHKDEEATAITCARWRLDAVDKELQGLSAILRTADEGVRNQLIKLLLRDAVLQGTITMANLLPIFAAPSARDEQALLQRLYEQLVQVPPPTSVQQQFQVTLVVRGYSDNLIELLEQLHASDGRLADPFEFDLDVRGSAEDGPLLTAFLSSVAAKDREAAGRVAQEQLQARLDALSIALPPAQFGHPQVTAVTEVLPLGENAPAEAATFAHQGAEPVGLAVYRPRMDVALAGRAVRAAPDGVVQRALAWWSRAMLARDALTQFSDLWSGLEHLVGPTSGLGFTKRLAKSIALPLLHRRGEALARELAQRLLRALTRFEARTKAEARAAHQLVVQLCIADEQVEEVQRLPVDALLRGPAAPLSARHSDLKTVDIRAFRRRLVALNWERARPIVADHCPGLLNSLLSWNEAVRNGGKLRGLIDTEYRTIVLHYGLCYDLRNRIQHEGEHFPGDGRLLIGEATDSLRTWLRTLLDALLKTETDGLAARLRRLQLPFEDLTSTQGGLKTGAPTEMQWTLFLGS